mmetsp:Transcript_2102/g.3066  ORF Transcript_2102/g.3066 Transcript_2102/m.3066 type:complete len:222 (-) Transcript_2102:193-858(-)|eukprot:CAMPEP_0113936976 /NCGR_PEP_ID=MMETSP1339-20121228/3704_1 /TAXON_ID=94617 /ORGANISM="Fibrocapsa japonica" /LENGTH=221 /DNA_ID=CAMNT_0000939571 /DNA_START=43 /DNA_END=708 /DNA_ORIENTATION=+ /assembly_acc=CAM_ASM_000762
MEWSRTSTGHQSIRQIQVGQHAPNFQATALLPSGDFGAFSLEDIIGRGKWLLLFFYPLDFNFVCPTEITAFSDNLGHFLKLGCEVVGCSVKNAAHLYWNQIPRNKGGVGKLQIPLIADVTQSMSRAYGVPLIGYRGMFLVDPRGVIRHTNYNELPVDQCVQEALRLLQTFQHLDSLRDERIPTKGAPGKRTLRDNVQGPQDFCTAFSFDTSNDPIIKRRRI